MSRKVEEKLLKTEKVAIELYNLVLELHKEDIELDWPIISMLESLEDLTKSIYQYTGALQLNARLSEQIKRLKGKI